MKKKLTKRGQNTILPIVGGILSEVTFGVDKLPTLVFRNDETESQLEIEDQIVLTRGFTEELLPYSKPGSSYDPKRLGQVLDLLGLRVSDALAMKDGTLQVEFEGGLMLKVASTDSYEAWHFQLPRPGRPASASNHPIILHGADGYLI